MTIYVVPCGLSVYEGLGGEPRPARARPAALISSAKSWGRVARELADTHVVGSWSAEVGHVAKLARLVDWEPEPLSAETHTLAASSNIGRLSRLSSDPVEHHQVVLLASDTGEGVGARCRSP